MVVEDEAIKKADALTGGPDCSCYYSRRNGCIIGSMIKNLTQ